jgi:hypothetical protein
MINKGTKPVTRDSEAAPVEKPGERKEAVADGRASRQRVGVNRRGVPTPIGELNY